VELAFGDSTLVHPQMDHNVVNGFPMDDVLVDGGST
jgi:hypothetical protein